MLIILYINFENHLICSRYSKESFQERDYGYNQGHDQSNDVEYESKFNKEYDLKSKYYNDKDENSIESYNCGNFDRESNYNAKM